MMRKPEVQSLETYLREVSHQLRHLSASARAEELREIEAHLRALVLAGQQLEDTSQAEATAAALKQFGAPRRVGRNLQKAWERKQPEVWWRAMLALAVAMAMRALFNVTSLELSHFYLADHDVDMLSGKPFYGFPNAPDVFASLLLYQQIAGVFTAIAIGYVVGLISPKRGVMLACLYATFTIIKDLPSHFLSSYNFGPPEILNIFATGATVLFVFTATGAYLGARYSKKRAVRITK